LIFPINRLAAQPLSPGGTSDIGYVLDFGLNRLVAMNIYQAVRHSSRFSWLSIGAVVI